MPGLVLSPYFWAKVEPAGALDCWLWTGALTKAGYGSFGVYSAGPPRAIKTGLAHRWAWLALRGEIPDGLTLDHRCLVRRCVNPWHVDLVPRLVNSIRRVNPEAWDARACGSGHEWTAETTGIRKDGTGRYCKACKRARYPARKAA